MSTYELGQTLQWELQVRDADGALADLGGGLPAALVTLPDGTTANANIEQTATGTYVATLTSSQAGRHRVTWTGSGTNSGGLPVTEVADVWPADPRLIISLADARATLDVQSANTVPDDELRALVVAATIIVEHEVGPVLGATVVEKHSGRGRRGLNLHRDAAAVVSVTEDGTALTASDYVLSDASVLYRGSDGSGVWSASAPANVEVTYSVGSSQVSQTVLEGAKRLVAHLYQWQQAPRPAFGGQPEMVESFAGMAYRAGYAVPHAVIEMLKPDVAPVRRASFA